jgi:hypothetical protein
MTLVADIMEERKANEIASVLLGAKCWNVGCGGCVGYTFQLALGLKIQRERPLKNPTISSEYRHFDGEFGLMVWCSWRLETARGPVTSSDDETPQMEIGLRRLAGKTISKVSILDGWFLRIEFSNGWVLSVFPDHVGPNASFDGNWEVWTSDRLYAVTTNLTCEVERRSVRGRVRQVVSTALPQGRTAYRLTNGVKTVRLNKSQKSGV